MTAPEPGARLDGRIAHPEGTTEPSGLAQALVAVDLVCDALAIEVAVLDGDHGGPGAPAATVQRLLLRSVPEMCGLLAPHLGELPPEDVARVLDHLFSRPPFVDRRMRSSAPRLRAHLDAYAGSLVRWVGWDSRTIELDEFERESVTVRWLTVWERPDDSAEAADFVGYVNDPADLARPGRAFAIFLRDAQSVFDWLDGEHHGQFKGLRLWIVGADGQPVIRWLKPE